MTTFKDQLTDDMAVFFDTAEMAEEHVIDGRTVAAVLLSHVGDVPAWPDPDGLQQQARILAVEARLIPRPRPGQVLRLDDVPYLVDDVDLQEGVLLIDLKATAV